MDSFKYLGVTIDHKLKRGDQIKNSISKATKVLNLLRRNLRNCSPKAKKRAYLAMVKPRLEFSAPVWSPHLKKDISALEKVQKRATRWMCAQWNRQNFTWAKSYDECRRKLQWTTLKQLRDILACCQIYKIVNHLDCIPFHQYFSFSSCNSRSHNLKLSCKQSRINCFRFSFFCTSPILWNSLPPDIANSQSLASFKSRITSYFLNL